MNVLAMNLQIAEYCPVEFAEHLVVIARNENYFGADEEQTIHLDVVQEVEQQIGAAAFEPQMDVRDKDRSQSRRGGIALRHVTFS
jgi:hypothetical protein